MEDSSAANSSKMADPATTSWANSDFQASSRCFLLQLSPELQIRVCEELADSTTSLARLGRACRVLNSAAVIVLYRHIKDSDSPSRLRADALLDTLSSAPALAKLVRSMDFAHSRLRQEPGQAQDQTWRRPRPNSQLTLASLCPNLTTMALTTGRSWSMAIFVLH